MTAEQIKESEWMTELADGKRFISFVAAPVDCVITADILYLSIICNPSWDVIYWLHKQKTDNLSL
jgi:hypothetical protein